MMKFYEYEPGNGTRYALMFGETDKTNEYMLVWLRNENVGGPAFRVMTHFGHIDQDYLMEKMRLDNGADAAALLGFLQEHVPNLEIHIHTPHNTKGQYVSNVLPLEARS
jgi:hypothetical protein